MRMSTSTTASAAMTLVRVPPLMTPGLTVMPRSSLVNLAIFSICRASSTIALAPFEKSTPACEATPRTFTVKSPTPLRAVFSFPVGPVPGSNTNTATLCLAASSVRVRDESLPTSSSEFTCSTTLRATGRSSSRNARIAQTKNARPPFMSNTPGPCSRPSFSRHGIDDRIPNG